MEKEQFYAAARSDIVHFAIATNPRYRVNWHHELIAQELIEIERKIQSGETQKTTFLLLEVPPRMGKSELASINFPAWFLGRNPEKEIITSSYSSELAQDFGSKTRDLVQSVEYGAIFGNLKLKEDSQSKAKWLTEQRGSYTSVGVGGALTGRGAHVLLIDDPIKNREEADSEVIRNKIWSWFTSTAFTRLEPAGCVIIIMQRWHRYDLIGKIKEEWKDRDDIMLRSICFPALAIKDEQYRKAGEALWPMRYDEEKLASMHITMGEIAWASQYQQEPILLENQEFKSEYFRYFEEEEIAEKRFDYTITLDPATGDKEVKRGDDSAIVVLGKERGKPDWYIVEIIADILDPLQTCDALFSLYERYRPRRILIESNGYQKTFKFWLTEEMKKREVYLPISETSHATKKVDRIRGLIPMYKTGVIWHRRNYLKLESQLLNFPMAEHDDITDALAMQMEAIVPTAHNDEKSYERAATQFLEPQKMHSILNARTPQEQREYERGLREAMME